MLCVDLSSERQMLCIDFCLLVFIPGKARGFFKTNDAVIILTGWRPGSGYTNTMRVVLVP